jgi:hypothetical protein
VTTRSTSSLPQARRLTPVSTEVSWFCEEPQSGILNRTDADFQPIAARRQPRTAAEHFATVIAFGRVLRDGQADDRYISTVIGRGYCFVAPIVRHDGMNQNATSTGSPKLLSSGRELSDTSREPLVAIIVDADLARRIMVAMTECTEQTQFASAAASAGSAGVSA